MPRWRRIGPQLAVLRTVIREVRMGWKQVIGALASGLVLAGVMTTNVVAQPRDDWRRGHRAEWELLGEKRVGFGIDRDIIRIGYAEDWYRDRRFRALHFLAEGNDVHMVSIRLVYYNGFAEDFRVDRLIRNGEELPLDLRGERSFIRSVEMLYRSRPGFGGEALIRVFGEPGRRGPPIGPPPGPMPGPSSWVELGCQQVSLFGKDRDSVPVGRREGRFKAIRLHARHADVELLRVTVIYANGQPDDLPTRHFLRQGGYTPQLDLKGWERSIERVDMVYKTVPNFKGQATVCVEGLS
jgi:hypothetical protein